VTRQLLQSLSVSEIQMPTEAEEKGAGGPIEKAVFIEDSQGVGTKTKTKTSGQRCKNPQG
jgi:hypothetical protein